MLRFRFFIFLQLGAFFIAVYLAVGVAYSYADSSSQNFCLSDNTKWLLKSTEDKQLEEFFRSIGDSHGTDIQFHLRMLVKTYPLQIAGIKCYRSKLWVLMSSGEEILYDDGKKKTVKEKMRVPDLEDSLSIPYTLDVPSIIDNPDNDPGRIRDDKFFKAVYGRSATEVKKRLRVVDFCGKKVRFTTVNGAARSLEKVAETLCPQVAINPALELYVHKLGGTFNWRKIAGTERMSAHSYGIAIDLNPKLSEYWRWHDGVLADFRRDDFPKQIIAAFEKEGFIWGGKWYHFDLMHFEYRPELLWMARERPNR